MTLLLLLFFPILLTALVLPDLLATAGWTGHRDAINETDPFLTAPRKLALL